MRRPLAALVALVLAVPLGAQGAPGPTLTLEDAIALARRNNPGFQQQLNQRRRAGNALRTAYGGLLPNANASFGSSYREGRPQVFGGVAFGANSDVITSNYSFNFSAGYSLSSLLNPRQASLTVDATDADVAFQEAGLRQRVTDQYVVAGLAGQRAELQDSLVQRQRLQLELARARETVGSGTSLDVKRAEVALGQQEVAAVEARNTAELEVVRLFQLLGVPPRPDARLVTSLALRAPDFDLDALLSEAGARNQGLQALRTREQAAAVGRRRATSAYYPSLQVSAGFGGFTNQFTDGAFAVGQAQSQVLSQRTSCFSADSLRVGAGLSSIAGRCEALVFTDADAARVRSANDKWPFAFQREPYTLSAGLSIPLFNGFQREQQVQEASLAVSDARQARRQAELQLTTDVTSAVLSLRAAWRSIDLQTRTVAAAQEALALAQERFRVGAAAYVDVATALNDYETAETNRLAAIAQYHRVYAQLELVVGRTLR